MFTPAVLNPLIAAFFGGFTGWLFGRRKYKAEAQKTELENVNTAITMWRTTAEELYKQVTHLTGRCEHLAGRCEQLTSRCEELTNEMEGMRRENNKLRSELKRLEKTINQSIN